MSYGLILSALADPTRRAIVEQLAREPKSVGELAHGFPVSRPAISQHLKVLNDAGVLAVTSQGARRVYRLDPKGMAELRQWLDSLWDTALAAFAAEAETMAKDNQRK
ncbi:helix-turn-helix transcriptional regulator [Actibacterium sp. 188UL27-1]|uniref:ArsR/SmtB family transcription factor n=1 Tax=Actibacterium sp. 188UL27-1 TaxID=2786961 RepID=UPI00195ECD96|nr:metalloregulator ArsR/SmtB family transcription factor [Actibacterium sp. 188UL27-1]MBM7068302.1 winged helix-turn-helix transcriptional regulator [Actibacterium sp. 188UL27-1]